MKLILLYSLYPPYTGGCATYSEMLMKGVASKRIEHTYLFTEHLSGSWKVENPRFTVFRVLPRRDSKIKRNRLVDLVSFVVTQLMICFLLVYVGIFSRRYIFQVHGRYAYRWVAGLISLLRIRAIVDLRDIFFLTGNLRSYSIILCASKAVEERVNEELTGYHGHVVYTPVPIDIDEIRELAGHCDDSDINLQHGHYFLFVGTLSKQKGICELIDGYRMYRAITKETVPLVIAGANRMGIDIAEMSRSGINYLGPKSRKEAYALIKHARLLILPSKAEGMPRVCLEAMALNVPIICPPNIREFIDHCPNSVLNSVSPESIFKMFILDPSTLTARDYPLYAHDCQSVMQQLFMLYKELANRA